MEERQSTKRRQRAIVRRGLVWLLLSIWASSAIAQQASSAASKPRDTSASPQEVPREISAPPAVVTIEGRPLFTVYEPIGPLTPQARAERIEQRILAIAQEGQPVTTAPATHFEIRPGWTEIYVGDQIVMAITETDAENAGKTRPELATEYAAAITGSIATFHQEHGWRSILRGLLRAVFTTVIFVAVLWLLNRMRTKIRDRVEKHLRPRAGVEQKAFWDIALTYAAPIVLAFGAILKWCLIIAVVESYLTLTLGFFSSTREMSLSVTKWFLSQLESMAKATVAYVPNLMVLVVIGLLTYYLSRLFRLLFAQIKKGELKIRGFYADWADPTEKLIRMLVFILALVVAFPYLPGATSPAFQGISIFLGLLLSLGSSSAVANALAGIILTYMRSFLIGDWVQIGDTMGEVAEKTLLVTRILTPKAEIITIPNATVMSGSVKNYSVEAKKSGVIFHTSVSIGYDAPWRAVHQLLIDAALATNHVLRQPSPFVLQNCLDDFYVSYDLNAYTDAPSRMLNIYSDLHQNIQDKFNEAGVEICSPHFSSLRDGNCIAIPEQYVRAGYRVPSFRVSSLKNRDDKPTVAVESAQSQKAG
jgi:small-conductance mechanosensitive channel